MFILQNELQILGYILIFAAILFLAYVAARLVGKKTSASMQSKHMQLIEQISLGIDKRLLLVRVGTEYFLFLSGKKEFKQVAKVKLDESDETQIIDGENNNAVRTDFRQVFSKYVSDYNEKRQNKTGSKLRDVDIKHDKSEVIQKNIRRLENLQGKSNDKEV